ncbi:hypothetical protein PoB_004603800 [Plakobranchus ocellatus]|uniref:Uncharacterized protein n=1 Tax=Plakobranchus ocellatus TaxID=259542 RepID=A0AAV4BK41_9GAST|nr:hypothetical protein PoB_004603800 [Plakobranchus ocellatus]
MKDLFDLWNSPDFQPVSQSIESVFGEEFTACQSDISVLKHFLDTELFNVSAFMSCFRSICKECANAITRQLSDFLEGGVFGIELDGDVKKILKTCPLHNLTGERLFGDLDYDINKRRNALLILRYTNNMLKHNRSVNWLGEQSPSLTKKLIERAIKYGPEWKAKSIREKKAVNEKIQERIAENKRKKDEKIIKAAERRSAALDAILAEGGFVVSSKEQLDEICKGPKAVERMKDQIR